MRSGAYDLALWQVCGHLTTHLCWVALWKDRHNAHILVITQMNLPTAQLPLHFTSR